MYLGHWHIPERNIHIAQDLPHAPYMQAWCQLRPTRGGRPDDMN